MINKSIYSSFIQAKNGTNIPVFLSGKTVESRYNPENSCDIILNTVTKPSFFLVTGISSGILIKKLTEKFPESKILAFEITSSDIDFLKQLETVQNISSNENVIFTTYDMLENSLIENYLPAICGDFQLIQQKPWIQENPEISETLPSIINRSLKKISADYSVQCHFGKRWQKNILTNLKIINNKTFSSQNFVTSKKAAIIAAGPTLENTIKILKENREDYVIFSTDTAYPVLVKNKVFPDAVVSIDGQLLSLSHFFEKSPQTHFYFDLCGNSSAVKNVLKHSNNLHFFVSGHPFSSLINSFCNNSFPYIYTGAGTVTISAFDLALKLGFTNFEVFAADFSYTNGKSYTKGTYLDSLYSKNATRIYNTETNFDKLIYRIPLKKITDNCFTTEVLESYKSSFEEYLTQNKCNFYKTNDIYFISGSESKKNEMYFEKIDFNNVMNKINSLSDKELQTPLLPLIANLRKNRPEQSFSNLLKLARTIVVSYN